MCLAVLALDESRQFPLVVVSNRDEFHDRPTRPLSWWSPGPGLPDVLSGLDERAGGSWMGLTHAGRFALVTNVRQPGPVDPQAPSRGRIVCDWLRGDMAMQRFWPRVALSGHMPFNLIAADFQQGACYWVSSQDPCARRLHRGLFGLSNAGLDTPWPKLLQLKSAVSSALQQAEHRERLSALLLSALLDTTPAADADLPATGVPLDIERMLSPVFIRSEDRRYGTRCTTVLITERVGKRLVTQVREFSHSPEQPRVSEKCYELRDWPPKYLISSGLDMDDPETSATEDDGLLPLRKPRVRSLLHPMAHRA